MRTTGYINKLNHFKIVKDLLKNIKIAVGMEVHRTPVVTSLIGSGQAFAEAISKSTPIM